MRLHWVLLLVAASLAAATLCADEQSPANESHQDAATIKSEIGTTSPLTVGKETTATIRLSDPAGKPVTPADLQVAHTEKIHLLVVDETLSDYHHVHPVESETPGEYRFDFAPKVGGAYRIWTDLVPSATGKQEYSMARVQVQGAPAVAEQKLHTTAEVDGLRFQLATADSQPLRAGRASLLKITVTTLAGEPFTALEPVMGAYAHMVAFPADLTSVTHVHPMGEEPSSAGERGGSELGFHVEPEKPGYEKLFLQVQIGGRDKFAAFGMKVESAAGEETAKSSYVCPMHPEVKQDAPGKCPKCGMTLVRQAKEEEVYAHQ